MSVEPPITDDERALLATLGIEWIPVPESDRYLLGADGEWAQDPFNYPSIIPERGGFRVWYEGADGVPTDKQFMSLVAAAMWCKLNGHLSCNTK